jgi:hypothetical protein
MDDLVFSLLFAARGSRDPLLSVVRNLPAPSRLTYGMCRDSQTAPPPITMVPIAGRISQTST